MATQQTSFEDSGTRTERRFIAGNEIVPVLDAWAERFGARLMRANKTGRRYKKEVTILGVRLPWYVEVHHDGKCFSLHAWLKVPRLLRLLAFSRIPRQISLENAAACPLLRAHDAFKVTNTLFKKLGLSLMEESHSKHPILQLRFDKSTLSLAGMLVVVGIMLFSSVTGSAGFKPGLYVPSRSLKAGLFFSMLIPALTAVGLQYWAIAKWSRGMLFKFLTVFLGITYFVGAFTWGLQRSGVVSLILLNETGYYCVQEQDSAACEKARHTLSSRPVAERQMLAKYADTLLNNYRPMQASPEQ